MPTKLFIRVEPDAHFVGATPDFVEVSRLPLEVGQAYLVQASGVLGLQAGVMMRMRLEVRSFFGSVLVWQEADYINTHQQFVLVVAASIPAEGGGGSGAAPPGASANLLMDSFWIQPPNPGESVYATEVTITALPVDEIVSA